ncbi:MAG: tRNA (adenosine(37)-N6)-threonylcarbamoyltransferase complex transferase subunit TsaD [Victivallales bacterium]|nr:tRNA (adenosine(37)-N6)-threonylcarbamoyltransferase complex transferase subunit TsaD [Victivallales bacterium]MBT7300995.1 tRNA (adenosine(37)-N6)-threonylcarbamoyltransferase complex transferase subunit TsaD [Victivallales bacterium]
MIVLGIETSCDETAAALVRDGQDVLGNAVASQIKLHAGYGGVVPELAAREHLRAMDVVVNEALAEAELDASAIDAVSVTCGPGLIPALLVGTSYAKGLAAALGCPFLGVNHFLAHIYGAFLGHPEVLADAGAFPLLALVASGGHTALVVIESTGRARIVGTTLDDAAGEAYDKGAKILGLGYPGGPVLDRIAKTGNPKAHKFPRGLTGGGGRPLKPEHRYNFSFSGVKTALLYATRDKELDEAALADVVASYQQAIVDVLVGKTIRAAAEYDTPTICMCGGVACNSQLRADMGAAAAKAGRQLVLAPPKYCTDNAAMVGGIAYHYLSRGIASEMSLSVSARLNHSLGTVPFAPNAQ